MGIIQLIIIKTVYKKFNNFLGGIIDKTGYISYNLIEVNQIWLKIKKYREDLKWQDTIIIRAGPVHS